MQSRESIQQKLDAFTREHGEWITDIELPYGIWTRGDARYQGRLHRILQILTDILPKPLSDCRVLDLGSLEGLFPLEFARRGARTVGVEGRERNLQRAMFCKACHELDNLELRLDDVRNLSVETYGTFDAIVCSGVFYHLTAPDAIGLASRLYEMTEHVLVMDTHVALEGPERYIDGDMEYRGALYLEHAEDSDQAVRMGNPHASLDNTTSFWFTRPSLVNLLVRAGFSSVYECFAPFIVRPAALFHLGADGSHLRQAICTFAAIKGKRCERPHPLISELIEKSLPEGALSYPFEMDPPPSSDAAPIHPAAKMKTEIPPAVFSADGAWCWFQDPRAVYVEGERRRTYANWITRDGQLQAGAYDHDSGEIETVVVKNKWGHDDHNVGSLLVLPDRRLMIFYARHNRTGLYCRTMSEPEDISRWRSKVSISKASNLTYSQPVYLRGENRMFVFWRGETWKPTFSTSADGRVWEAPRILIQDERREDSDIRPYLKVVSDGEAAIHFAFTDGHPRDEPRNSIYYAAYREGVLVRADGSAVGSLEHLPLPHREAECLYDGSAGRAWVWDIALDASGHPVIVYVRMPEIDDHRYHYLRWTGRAWEDHEITAAGGWFPQTPAETPEIEPFYSGGLALDPADPSIVYLSRPEVDRFQIERWTTTDGGHSWLAVTLPGQSTARNVRPVVPRGHRGPSPEVLWMQGDYRNFRRFSTRIVRHGTEEHV